MSFIFPQGWKMMSLQHQNQMEFDFLRNLNRVCLEKVKLLHTTQGCPKLTSCDMPNLSQSSQE
jgi:hypothetical protein